MDSILNTVKKTVTGSLDDNSFDEDLIMSINTVFFVLNQLGIGPDKCFSIEDDSSEWTDFTQDITKIEAVKTYMCLKIRLLFDPPTNSTLVELLNSQAKEMEIRMMTAQESYK